MVEGALAPAGPSAVLRDRPEPVLPGCMQQQATVCMNRAVVTTGDSEKGIREDLRGRHKEGAERRARVSHRVPKCQCAGLSAYISDTRENPRAGPDSCWEGIEHSVNVNWH